MGFLINTVSKIYPQRIPNISISFLYTFKDYNISIMSNITMISILILELLMKIVYIILQVLPICIHTR
jgi:hypothetical protein